ncbi:MAG: Type 1 glutamine amidotransferase-like domain-containing protein [Nanoarchaeota archaeon]|nr:Type 1 glutamine amidotransferase-like domain-containing protein [Nanoarchaeota archaeon]
MKGRLFLSGGGNEKQTHSLDEIFMKDINTILYIPLAWPNGDYNSCLEWFTKLMAQHKKKEIEIEMLIDLTKEIELTKYDAIYIGGGNTFKLLKLIKDSNFGKKLINYYNAGGTIYGGSAGAIILGRDINIALICKDADVNKVKLKDTTGLSLIKNYDIQCHFEEDQIQEHIEYIKKTNRNIIAIPEVSALLKEDNSYKAIGLKPITIISLEETKEFAPGEKIQI